MSVERTRTQIRRQTETADVAPGTDEPSPLLQQAQGWVDVARDADEDCVQEEEAERSLERRRNTSGQ